MNNRIILVLLIAAIVLSVLSVVLTLSSDTSKAVSSTTIIREKWAEPATVGLVIQGTVANTNG